MTRLAVIVPTIGRPHLADTLASLTAQLEDGDRVMVVCDDGARYDFCSAAVADAREAGAGGVTWRSYCNPERLGCFGHPSRNKALDLLDELDDAPSWVWSLDDDDVALPGAVAAIREAIVSGDAPWYVFRMRGGEHSHFPGLVVPTMGPTVKRGNIGTPMIVAPVAQARFGVGEYIFNGHSNGPGYFGDYDFSLALERELSEPQWRDAIVCEVRP